MISYETYQQEMRRNLLLMSRTANGVVDTSASADKAKYMLIQSGENAAKTVSANVENALRLVYEHRAYNFENAEVLKTFLLRIAQTVNAGVLTPGCLMRQGADSKIFRYVKIEFLPMVFDKF